jgi:hypothetical protein
MISAAVYQAGGTCPITKVTDFPVYPNQETFNGKHGLHVAVGGPNRQLGTIYAVHASLASTLLISQV